MIRIVFILLVAINSSVAQDHWYEVDGKWYLSKQAKGDCDCSGGEISTNSFGGIADWGKALANITTMISSNKCDEKMMQIAERLRIKNNSKTLKSLIKVRKMYDNGDITFFELMNRKADLLQLSVEDLYELEVSVARLSTNPLYSK